MVITITLFAYLLPKKQGYEKGASDSLSALLHPPI